MIPITDSSLVTAALTSHANACLAIVEQMRKAGASDEEVQPWIDRYTRVLGMTVHVKGDTIVVQP